MADWKVYMRAAQNTAKKQAPGAKRALQDSTRRATERASGYGKAASKAINEGTREGRESLRREGKQFAGSSRAAVTVAQRRAREANVGRRIWVALRDALIMGAALAAIWFVFSAAGIAIPFSAVLIAVVLVIVVRFAWALYSQFAPRRDDSDNDPADDRGPDAREYDPR